MAAAMKLQSIEYRFILLTPAMVGGAGGKSGYAEMRIASIRGQVRWWHRAAGLSPGFNQVWGQTDGSIIASRVSLALAAGARPAHGGAPILPHDLKKSGPPRDALNASEIFTVTLRRLVGCSPDHWLAAQRAVKLWLLLGCIGLRANRAAGSVWPLDDYLPESDRWVPADEQSLRGTIRGFGYSKIVQLADPSILGHGSLKDEPTHALKLRHAASDTVSDSQYFGSIKPQRKPSPLKMKVIRLGAEHRLLLTGLASSADFIGARSALGTGKPLGNAAWA